MSDNEFDEAIRSLTDLSVMLVEGNKEKNKILQAIVKILEGHELRIQKLENGDALQ